MAEVDIFGLWDTAPAAAVSFDVTEAADAPAVCWRLDLPRAAEAAQRQLERGEAQAQAAEAGLAVAPQRLDQLLLVRRQAQTGDISFAVAEPLTHSVSAQELWRWLDEAQAVAPVSFGAEAAPGRSETQTELQGQFEAGVERLQRLIAHAAWVETRCAGELLGQTLVGWTGDMRTVWWAAAAPAQQAWHRRSLALALASRAMLLRILLITAQGAGRLATALALPGGVALALPAVWKFVNQVLAELGEYQKLTHSI